MPSGAGLDSQVDATGSDILEVLSESEAACVREGLSEEQFAAMTVAQPLDAVSIGSSVSGCIEPETNIKIFTAGIQWALGDTTEETVSCLEDFARNTPIFVALFASGLKGMQEMPADQFVEITDLGTWPVRLYDRRRVAANPAGRHEGYATAVDHAVSVP